MSKRALTAHLIAEALDSSGVLLNVQPAEGWACTISFDYEGDGELTVTLHDEGGIFDDHVETRTFRLVEDDS